MANTLTTVPFFMHDLGQAELDSIAQVLKGTILTTGETVLQFEKRFADLLGVSHAIGVTSCTGALHMSLLALDIGPGDEVITTPLTFIATSTAILEVGAKPVFVDVEPDTGNLDASKIESAITKHTRAIIPVHLYGQMCDMRSIKEIANKYGLYIIEDSAHCINGERDGICPGQLSDTACFSFYATKNLTCGEGGAVITKNNVLADKLRLLRLHGMTKTAADRQREGYKHWDMVMLGWKYNMDNIQAALLLPQMDRIESNLKKRNELAAYYEEKLANIRTLTRPQTLSGVRHAWHLFPVWVDGSRRDLIIDGLQELGIGVVVNYRAIHLLSYFREKFGFRGGNFPIAEHIGDVTLSLPFYPGLSKYQVDIVVGALRTVLG